MPLLNNKEIGKRLTESRGAITSRKYALDAGVDPSQFSKIEKGELPITDNIMDKLSGKYKLDKNFILFGTNIPHDKNIKSSGKQKKLNTEISDPIMQALFNISESNKTATLAALTSSQAVKDIAQSNLELSLILKKQHTTAGDLSETIEGVQAKVDTIQEFFLSALAKINNTPVADLRAALDIQLFERAQSDSK